MILTDLTISEIELPLEETHPSFGANWAHKVIGGNDLFEEQGGPDLPTGYTYRTGCDGRDPVGSDANFIQTDWRR